MASVRVGDGEYVVSGVEGVYSFVVGHGKCNSGVGVGE